MSINQILMKQSKNFLEMIQFATLQLLPLPILLMIREKYQPNTTTIIDSENYQKIFDLNILESGIFGPPVIDERNNIAVLYCDSKLYLRNDSDIIKYFGVSSKIFNIIFHQYGLTIESDYRESFVLVDEKKICVRFYLSVRYQKHDTVMSIASSLNLDQINQTDLNNTKMTELLKIIHNAYSHVEQIGKIISNINDYWSTSALSIQNKIQKIYLVLKSHLEKQCGIQEIESKNEPMIAIQTDYETKIECYDKKMYYNITYKLPLNNIKYKIPKTTLEDQAITAKNLLYLTR